MKRGRRDSAWDLVSGFGGDGGIDVVLVVAVGSTFGSVIVGSSGLVSDGLLASVAIMEAFIFVGTQLNDG